jgi:hypothetical protein
MDPMDHHGCSRCATKKMLETADTADGLLLVSLSKGFVHEIHDRNLGSKEINKLVPVGTPQIPVQAG